MNCDDSADSDNFTDLEMELEQRVNPLHLLPQLTMNSKGAKCFDFGTVKDSDIDWMSIGSANKIKLSDAASSESADCEVIKGGDDMFDLISSSSHNLDAYSMASLGDYGGDFGSAEKGKNSSFCYTPSGKSQLKVKLL